MKSIIFLHEKYNHFSNKLAYPLKKANIASEKVDIAIVKN